MIDISRDRPDHGYPFVETLLDLIEKTLGDKRKTLKKTKEFRSKKTSRNKKTNQGNTKTKEKKDGVNRRFCIGNRAILRIMRFESCD